MFLPSKLRERENTLLFRLRPTFGLTVPEGIVGVRSGVDLMSRVYTAMFLDKKLTIVCKDVPQFSTIPRSGGGDIGVGGQDVPHMSQPRMNSVGGSTLLQWQNWRSLRHRILLQRKFFRRLT